MKEVKSGKVINQTVFVNAHIFLYIDFSLCFHPLENQVLCDPVFLTYSIFSLVLKVVENRRKSAGLARYKMKFVMSSIIVRT